MRISKTLTFVLILVVLLAIIKLVYLKKPEQASMAKGGMKASVNATAVVVKPVKMEQVIYATGSIMANEEVELHPEMAGKLVGINFKEGSRVSKGSLLVKINDAELQAQLQKINLELKLAEDRLKRNEKLLKINGISQQEYDVLQNEVQSLKADRDVVEAQILKSEIHAPFNGIIGLKSVSEGSYVTPQTAIASLQQIDPVKIDFSVPEKYAGNIKVGDEIMFTVGGSQKNYRGKIYAIEPRVDEMTRTVQVRAICPNADAEVLPGAFAKITLVLSGQPDALMVPTECIVPILKGQQVYVYHDGKAEAIKVETGIRTDTTIQITNGIKENDTLINTGIMQLKPGAEVKLLEVK